MWGGRFASAPAHAFDRLNRSLPVDQRLWAQDLIGSMAWTRALKRAGILTASEERQMLDGLERIKSRLADGPIEDAPDEDIHTLVERLLFDEVGELAGKLHTRSLPQRPGGD